MCYRDGRLCEGDQLLAIDGQPLLDITHQQAIHILQGAQGPVEVVVARGPVPNAPGQDQEEREEDREEEKEEGEEIGVEQASPVGSSPGEVEEEKTADDSGGPNSDRSDMVVSGGFVLSLCLSLLLAVCLSLSLSVCLSVSLSCLSICLSVCLSFIF